MRIRVLTAVILITATLLMNSCGESDSVGPPDPNPFAGLEFGDDDHFEIVTWNLKEFPLQADATIEAVAYAVESMDADVIGLQEINSGYRFNQLVDALPGYTGYRSGDNSFNLAWLYKTATVTVDTIYEIFPDEQPLPRAPLVMECEWNDAPLVLIDNHFKCCGNGTIDYFDSWDEEYRRLQSCLMIHQYITDEFPDSRVVMVGDLNDYLTDETLNNVFNVFIDDPLNFRFADMAIAQGLESIPSYITGGHLDHIMVSNELFTAVDSVDGVVRTINLDARFSTYRSVISDHRPVGMKISLD